MVMMSSLLLNAFMYDILNDAYCAIAKTDELILLVESDNEMLLKLQEIARNSTVYKECNE